MFVDKNRLRLRAVAGAAKVNAILHIDDLEGPDGAHQVYVLGSGQVSVEQSIL